MTKPGNTFWCDGCCDHILASVRAGHRLVCTWETFKYAGQVDEVIAKLRISAELDEPEAGGTDGSA